MLRWCGIPRDETEHGKISVTISEIWRAKGQRPNVRPVPWVLAPELSLCRVLNATPSSPSVALLCISTSDIKHGLVKEN